MNSINSLTRHLVGSASPDKSNRNDHTLDHYVKRAKSLKSKSKKGSLSSDSGSVTSRSPSPEPWSSAGKPRTPVFRGKKRSQSPQPTSTGKRTKRDSSPFDIPIYEQQGIGVNVSFVAPDHISIHDKGYRDWTQEEVDLLNRLNDRGGAPFIPPSWAIDFETLPTNNFTVDGETAFFRALNIEETGEFRAMKALSTLVLSGTRVRDALDTPSKEPSRVLERTVIDYIRWSEDDADLEDRDIIPALYIRRQRKSDDIQDTVDDLTYDLKEAATRIRLHKNSMNKIKVIYGVVIAKTVTAFVSYEVAKSDGEVRNLAVFNWMDEGQDVWNALAIAILVITVRDMLYSLDAERIGYSPEQDSDK